VSKQLLPVYDKLFIPQGFAHGFCVLSKEALFSYKCSDLYSPETESGVIWNDPDIGIEWPIKEPILSEKDRQFSPLRDTPESVLHKYA
jgi:dTDP-4-dehydrorhamnose 3,5-epimerase